VAVAAGKAAGEAIVALPRDVPHDVMRAAERRRFAEGGWLELAVDPSLHGPPEPHT